MQGSVHELRSGGSRRRRLRVPEWPTVLVLGGVATALLLVWLNHFRRGCLLLSASVGLALVLRAVLPSRVAGLLAVRSRRVDVAVLTVLTAGLTLFTLWVPPPTG